MKKPLSKSQVITIIASLILLVVIYFVPKTTPLGAEEPVKQKVEGLSQSDDLIEEAVSLVLNGTEPMKGIMMLRDVLEKDPENVKAHLVLGMFSIQSGQYEKAIERFKTVLSIDPDATEAYLYLSEIYEKEGKTDLAIENLNNYKSMISDSAVIDQVNHIIKKLKNI